MQLVDDATIAKNANRVLERVSPSQIEAYELCPRRWYNQSIRGLREDTTPAQQRGTDIGAEAEHFYKSGALRSEPKFLAMVEPVLSILGPPRESVSVEEWVETPIEGGPTVRGRYDFVDVAHAVRVLGEPAMPLLADIKSRSDFRYIKTEAELAQDLQLNAYARPLVHGLGLDRIAIQHVYTLTKLSAKGIGKGRAVTVAMTKEALEPRWQKTVASAREMARWAKERPKTADPLPPNTAACSKFPPKGCPHKALCGFDGVQESTYQIRRTETMTTDNPNGTSALLERLKQQQAALMNKGAMPTVETPPPAATPINPVVAAKMKIADGALRLGPEAGSVFAKEGPEGAWLVRPSTLAEKTAFEEPKAEAAMPEPPAAVSYGFCAKCGVSLSANNASKLLSGAVQHIGCGEVAAGPAVVPPDAPPRTNQPGDAEAAAPKTRKKRGSVKVEGEDGKMHETTAEDLAAGTGPVSTPPAAQPSKALETQPPTAPAERRRLVLWINSIQTKGEQRSLGVHFEEWMAPIMEELCREKGVLDYRLIQYTAKGDLATKVRLYAATLPEVVLVSKFSPSADVFLEAVIPLATEINQGL